MSGKIFEVQLANMGQTLPFAPLEDSIILPTTTIMAGISIPLPWEVFQILNELDIALGQLSPNTFRTLVGTMVLFKLEVHQNLTLERFKMMHQIKDNHSSSGMYYPLGLWGI